MDGQAPLYEIPMAEPTFGPCAWCQVKTHSRIELEPTRYRIDKPTGVKVIRRQPILAWCCAECDRRLVRSKPEKDEPDVVVA